MVRSTLRLNMGPNGCCGWTPGSSPLATRPLSVSRPDAHGCRPPDGVPCRRYCDPLRGTRSCLQSATVPTRTAGPAAGHRGCCPYPGRIRGRICSNPAAGTARGLGPERRRPFDPWTDDPVRRPANDGRLPRYELPAPGRIAAGCIGRDRRRMSRSCDLRYPAVWVSDFAFSCAGVVGCRRSLSPLPSTQANQMLARQLLDKFQRRLNRRFPKD